MLDKDRREKREERREFALCLQNIHKAFGQGVDRRVILDGLDFSIDAGEFVTLLGSNGAGKSTLFSIIAGSMTPDRGRVFINGRDVTMVPDYKRARSIGRLFQDVRVGTAPELTIEENLALVYARGAKRFPLSRALHSADRRLFREKLARYGMGLEDRLKTRVGALSGGQRQALSLLLATLVPPAILLLDEHTAALDPESAKRILDITREVTYNEPVAALMITHNLASALEMGTRTVMLRKGKIVMDVRGDERKSMTADVLLRRYREASGEEYVEA
jgi:putative ABC transport system ATP-binding protein